ncbi:hypothetical protein L7F22_061174 [Adiantum nelumboides]|nr:hypothetical protein [Adiantum nelumboides]
MKNKGLTSRELLREFEKKFDQLSTGEQQSLRSEKVELFVQAADSRLQKSLVQLLEDPVGELDLTNDWDAVPAAINLLVKRQKRIDKSIVVDSHEDFEENGIVEKIVEKPKASSSPMLEGKEKPKATQSSTLDDSTMDDLIKGIQELNLNLKDVRLEKSSSSEKPKDLRPKLCIWYRKIHLTQTEQPLRTNFGRGGMKKIVCEMTSSTSTYAMQVYKDENEEEVKASTNLWPHALRTAKAGKVTSFTLQQAGDSIQETTGWTDLVDSLLVYAYIAKAQANEAFVEDKRKREDEAPETSKRQTQANTRSDGERMQKSTPISEVQMEDASKDKKQSKVHGPSYKLRFDIELATNLKKVFEEHMFSQGAFSSSFVGLTLEGSYSYKKFGELHKWEKQHISHFQSEMQGCAMLDPNDVISGIFEEVSHIDTIADLKAIDVSSSNNDFIKVNSFDMYEVLSQFCEKCEGALEVQVETKYKTVTKKVRPQAVPLPKGSDNVMEKASQQPILRDSKKIGHKFTKETLDSLKIGSDALLTEVEIQCFKEMLSTHGKAFSFEPHEIGCVDPKVVAPMVIFTVPHMPWNLRPIPVLKVHISKLIDLLNEKMRMDILEPSSAPYSSRWFTVPKKNGSLRFIQDLQPVNKVTIRNVGTGPIVDEFAKAFAGRAIYSMGDLYSGYDQFQLSLESRDITTIRTPLGLVRMCTLPQGATNSVAHMMNGMNKEEFDHVYQKKIQNLPARDTREYMEDYEASYAMALKAFKIFAVGDAVLDFLVRCGGMATFDMVCLVVGKDLEVEFVLVVVDPWDRKKQVETWEGIVVLLEMAEEEEIWEGIVKQEELEQKGI